MEKEAEKLTMAKFKSTEIRNTSKQVSEALAKEQTVSCKNMDSLIEKKLERHLKKIESKFQKNSNGDRKAASVDAKYLLKKNKSPPPTKQKQNGKRKGSFSPNPHQRKKAKANQQQHHKKSERHRFKKGQNKWSRKGNESRGGSQAESKEE